MKTILQKLSFVFAVILVACALGCSGGKPTVAGAWKGEQMNLPPGRESPKSTLHLNDDGTFRIEMSFGEMTGTWALEDGKVHMKAEKMAGKALSGPEQNVDLDLSSDQQSMTSDKQQIKWTREPEPAK